MKKSVEDFISRINNQPDEVMFDEVITLIDAHHNFSSAGFDNGQQRNEAGENSGSCKVLSFAQLYSLTQDQALALFGQYYRDVKATPTGDDHQNIRQFMQHSFAGLKFDKPVLSKKT